jgi:hypothetical protein
MALLRLLIEIVAVIGQTLKRAFPPWGTDVPGVEQMSSPDCGMKKPGLSAMRPGIFFR